MTHRFGLGQSVRLVSLGASRQKTSPDGFYKIIRLMPEDQGGDVHYRLQSSAGERVAPESELEAAPTMGGATTEDVFMRMTDA